MEILRCEAVTKVYGRGANQVKALDGVSLSIFPGEFLGVIGHTGSGKSTLIQHLNALLRPTSGQVLLGSEDIWKDKHFTRQTRFRVGLVFQYPEYQLFEETVAKDIAFGPKNMGLQPEEIDRRVREAAGFAGLPEALLDKSPFDLSGGQKRRVAIAGVIAMEPEVLILDEPTAGLDPAGRESILDNLRRFQQAKNAAIVMVSHSMEEVAANAGRLIVMDEGRVFDDGAPAEVFARAEALQQIGLAVPQVTAVFLRLRAMGLSLPPVYTVEQARRAILAAKEARSC